MSEYCKILSFHDILQDAELGSVFLRLGMSEKLHNSNLKYVTENEKDSVE
jgi:hypothetical protein